MTSLVLHFASLCAVSWFVWRWLRRYIIKNDLKNVPGPSSSSFVKGNFGQVFSTNGWDFARKLRDDYGKVVRIEAFLGDMQLYVSDPLALHHIVVKDQHIYEETSGFISSNQTFLGMGLLGTLGEQHRKQRKMLNPVFSIAHMRQMVPIFYDVTHKLQAAFTKKVANGPQEIQVTQWMARTALELIGQSGLGWSFDPLREDADEHPYSRSVKQLIPASFPLLFYRTYFLSTLLKIGSPRFRRWVVDKLTPIKDIQRLKHIVDIIHKTSVEIFEAKKKAFREGDEAVARQIGAGKDIISILMRANMEASEEDRLPDSEVLGQLSSLTFAAMDTTSNALSRILHLLATHQDVQDRLRKELREAGEESGGQLSYDQLVNLPYMDAICRETLRLYPSVPQVSRTTRSEVVLPLLTPIKGVDGREMRGITIPNNTNVIVSILNTNRDPDLWGPDSYEWKPQRWLAPPLQSVTDAHLPGIYSNLMTFLGGSRACIGFKFSQLEMKTVLAVLIPKFRFSPGKEEIVWEMSNIVYPTIKGKPGVAQLPLMVEAI